MLADDESLPNELRWLIALRVYHLQPWFISRQGNEYEFASTAFGNEDINNRAVFTFARRQDCDDFAGLEIVDGVIRPNVIYFHPVFGSGPTPAPRTWDIVCGEYEDVFAFLSDVIAPAMRDWALTEDAADIDYDYRETKPQDGG